MRSWNKFKNICTHIIMGTDAVLVGILLIPVGILFIIIYFILEITDKIVRLLEVKS